MQYRLKPGMKQYIKEITTVKKLAEEVGVGNCYMSQVLNNRRKSISKMLAYSICKVISPELEIKDLFDIIQK